jgi:hypothetical protein
MLEMKLQHAAVALARRLDAEAGEQAQALVGLADLLVGRPDLGQDEIVALPAQGDVEVELVERDLDRAVTS